MKGRYFLEAVVIPVRKVVKKTQPLREFQEIHSGSEEDEEEPSRKRSKITAGSSPAAQHNESDSTEQVQETDGNDIEIEQGSLVGTPHPDGHLDPDQQDIIPGSLTDHEDGGQGQAVSEEGDEGQTSTVDEPGWADLIDLWKEHDFQWALQRDRTEPSKVRPYSSDIVFGTTVLKRR
ncbi:hypothetical protein BG006_008387 [Podila minutissima]|uniref:Uncharacterized protein n=1 Tax=Podila minutissima TaxID=64525 RepID=A0A9P5VK66_9FUNG|nr:hypothetical protein BG006_008387 [Podila minutissima]